MAGFADKPTIEVIERMTAHLKEVWRDTHDKWRVADTFYNRTFPLWDPALKRPVVHPAKAKSIVDTAVDQMMGHEPTFERFPAHAGQSEDADSVEKSLKSMYAQMGLLEAELTLETAKKHLVIYGYAVLEDTIDSVDLAFHQEEKPSQKRGETDEEWKRREALWNHKKKTLMPFRNRAPHPADVLIDPSHKNPRVAVKVGKWYAGDLAELTNNRFDADGRIKRGDAIRFEVRDDPFELIDCVEYWTESWHALMVTGSSQSFFGRIMGRGQEATLLIVDVNTWGFVPFSHAFAGFGHQPTDHTERGTKFLAVGMLDSIMDDLVMDAQRTAGMHNALIEATFAKRGTTEDPADIENQEAQSDTLELQGKGSLWYLEQPTLPAHLQNFGIENNKDIEEATFTRGLGGIRDQGVSTVGQQALLNSAGHRRFIAPTQQINQLYTKSAEHMLQWIDILDLDLTIEGNHINRSMINGDYSVKVEHKVVDPVLQMQERQQALNEFQAGVMDLETFWAIAGRGDATGARKRLYEDLVYAHPLIQQKFIEAAAQEMGLDKLLDDNPQLQAPQSGGGNEPSKILGPDGQPLDSTLGSNPIRQPLDSRTVKPAPIDFTR